MAGMSFETPTTPDDDAKLTAAEREARAASIMRARAQAAAGETVPGEVVFEWLASWGTENELPMPKPDLRRS